MHSGERQQWKSARNKSGGILAPARFSEWRTQNSGALGLRVFKLQGSVAPHNWLSHPSTRPNTGEKRSAQDYSKRTSFPHAVWRGEGPVLTLPPAGSMTLDKWDSVSSAIKWASGQGSEVAWSPSDSPGFHQLPHSSNVVSSTLPPAGAYRAAAARQLHAN